MIAGIVELLLAALGIYVVASGIYYATSESKPSSEPRKAWQEKLERVFDWTRRP